MGTRLNSYEEATISDEKSEKSELSVVKNSYAFILAALTEPLPERKKSIYNKPLWNAKNPGAGTW
jgi:hypothetical protein